MPGENLLGGNAPVKLPAMLVKVKTPELPLHLAGETQRQDLDWQIALSPQGMVARGTDTDGQMRAFVVSEDRMKEAFALLKSLLLNPRIAGWRSAYPAYMQTRKSVAQPDWVVQERTTSAS